jgi:glucose/arabinose dehydrogenase
VTQEPDGSGDDDGVDEAAAAIKSAVPLKPAIPATPVPQGKVKLMDGERIVFTEESNPQSYLKLIASGDVDETMLEALEDYVKRQKRRLGVAVPRTPGTGGQVPFMITNAQKQQLREMGHDDDAINKMTPEQAHKALGVLG